MATSFERHASYADIEIPPPKLRSICHLWSCAAVLASIGVAALGWAESFAWLFAAPILCSVGFALCSPAMVALLSDLVPASRQGVALGAIGALEDLGLVVGGALVGILLSAAGRATACGVLIAILLAGALLCLWSPDAGYDALDPTAAGARHRLLMHGTGGWVYERT